MDYISGLTTCRSEIAAVAYGSLAMTPVRGGYYFLPKALWVLKKFDRSLPASLAKRPGVT